MHKKYTRTSQSILDSKYLKLYDQTPRTPSHENVISGLNGLSDKDFVNTYIQIQKTHPGWVADLVCVTCWTLESPRFYGALKIAITYDTDELKHWIAFIRALTSALVLQFPHEMITYRGSKMTQEDYNKLSVGQYFRIPYFVATSLSPSVAEIFKKSPWCWEFHIPEGCPNACDISQYSAYDEGEVLLPPYTLVKILSKTNSKIVVSVLDNQGNYEQDGMPGLAGGTAASGFIGIPGLVAGTVGVSPAVYFGAGVVGAIAGVLNMFYSQLQKQTENLLLDNDTNAESKFSS